MALNINKNNNNNKKRRRTKWMEIDNLWRKFCNEESWKLNWRNKSGNGNEDDKKNDWKRNDDGTVRIKK